MEKVDMARLDTLPKRLKALADLYPERELFIFISEGRRYALTASRMFNLAGKFAAELVSRGFRRGDVIANTLPNSPERIVTDVGILLAGCTTMNGQITLADGSDFFKSAWQARANGVILCPEDWSPAWRLFGPHGLDRSSGLYSPLKVEGIPDMTRAFLVWPAQTTIGTPLFDVLDSRRDADPPTDISQANDVAVILTTSGSTGYSKLVPRTHEEFIAIATSFAGDGFDHMPGMYFAARPLGWFGGLPLTNYAKGQCRVLIDTMPTHGITRIEDVVHAILQEKCTAAFCLPLECQRILDYTIENGIEGLKLFMLVSGGQPMKKSHLVTGLKLSQRYVLSYGSTEASGISQQPWTDPEEFEDFYCGRLGRGVSIRVLDGENKECPHGVVGQVQVKGPFIFSGYFDRQQTPNPETVAAFTDDGWFKTTDYGWLRPQKDGALGVYIIGREKDVIDRGGIHLYPGWLEAKVMTHPEINEACVLPIKEPVRTHKVCLIVKTQSDSDLDEAALTQFCRSLFAGDARDLFTPFPDFFKVLKGNDFPELVTGKANLQMLREMAESLFGARESDSL